jgi:hypothetical protein
VSCFKGISLLNRCEILALVDSVSLALSDDLSQDDLNALGNLIVTIGSTMLTFATLSTDQSSKESKVDPS